MQVISLAWGASYDEAAEVSLINVGQGSGRSDTRSWQKAHDSKGKSVKTGCCSEKQGVIGTLMRRWGCLHPMMPCTYPRLEYRPKRKESIDHPMIMEAVRICTSRRHVLYQVAESKHTCM